MKQEKIIALAITLALATSSVHAGKSKKWRANNHSDHVVKVFWRASGCAGMKPNCGGADDEDEYLVCKTKILQPGEESEYRFPDGTSDRMKGACATDWDKIVRYTKTRKRNGIKVGPTGQVDWYDD